MKETTKTSIFLAVALLLAVVAVATRPRVDVMKSEEMVGKPLFPKFDDPLAVKSLEIVRPATLEGVNRFTVADQNGFWTIPSHDGYPADAKDRMPNIADALISMSVLGVADSLEESKDRVATHALYGVIDPTSESASLGEGVGTRVTITGAQDETLVDLIIGKAVEAGPRGSELSPPGEEERKAQRYVRVAGEQAVYVVPLEAERFSTKFVDWIEKNLLDINTLDIREIFVDEYSVSDETRMIMNRPVVRLVPNPICDIRLAYDGNATGAAKWTLEKLMGYRGRNFEYVEQQMNPDEELNLETLDAAIFALNDLTIVDAVRKSDTVATVLRNGESLEKLESDPSMFQRGFGVARDPRGGKDDKPEKQGVSILSRDGDFRITMKDGIRYILRFGNSASLQTGDDGDGTQSGQVPSEASVGINRYLFIMAEFDPESVPKPRPQPLVPVPTEGAEKPVADRPVDGDAKKDDAKENEASGDAGAVKSAPEKYTAEDVEAAKKENEAIAKHNQRAEDAYNAALEKGTKRAAELNVRFAPWYYVIAEDVYKKIHLSRTNVFRPKTPDREGGQSGETGHDDHAHDHARDAEALKQPEKVWPTLPGADPKSLLPEKLGMEKAEPVRPEAVPEEAETQPEPVPVRPEPPTEEVKPEAEKQPETLPEEALPEHAAVGSENEE